MSINRKLFRERCPANALCRNRRRRAIPLVLLLLCSFGFAAIPIPGRGQPLDSLVSRAIAKHPSIASIRLSISRAQAAAGAAGGWEPPRAGVEISMLPPRNPNPLAAGETMFMVEQEIPLFGQNNAMAQAMRLEADVREEELAATARELRAEIEAEYYRIILLERRSALNREFHAIAELIYADAETRYSLNRGSQSDLYMPAIEMERLEAELRSIRIQRQTAQEIINTLLLGTAGDTIIADDALPLDSLPEFDELAAGLEASPELRKMEAMARMNLAQAAAAESMLDPMLMVRGGMAVMPQGHPVRMAELGDMVDEFHNYGENSVDRLGLTAGVMVSIPLAPWSRSGPEGEAEEARIGSAEATARKEGMRQEMTAMLRREYGMAQEARIWIAHYRDKQIPLLEQSLKTLRIDYMNGGASITSLMETYRMLLMAQEEIAMRETEYATALAQIRKLTSGK